MNAPIIPVVIHEGSLYVPSMYILNYSLHFGFTSASKDSLRSNMSNFLRNTSIKTFMLRKGRSRYHQFMRNNKHLTELEFPYNNADRKLVALEDITPSVIMSVSPAVIPLFDAISDFLNAMEVNVQQKKEIDKFHSNFQLAYTVHPNTEESSDELFPVDEASEEDTDIPITYEEDEHARRILDLRKKVQPKQYDYPKFLSETTQTRLSKENVTPDIVDEDFLDLAVNTLLDKIR